MVLITIIALLSLVATVMFLIFIAIDLMWDAPIFLLLFDVKCLCVSVLIALVTCAAVCLEAVEEYNKLEQQLTQVEEVISF